MYISKYREAIVLENKYKNEHRTMVPRTVKAPSHREMCPQRPEGEKPEHTFRKKPEHTGMKKVMAQPACVDTRKGDKQLLEKSGLVPFYLQKNDYGIVPGYLRRRKAEKEKAKQDNDAWLTKQQETVKPLAEQEKQNILQGLKRRFNELNFEYQSLPFTISPSQHKKYNYKMFLEEAMSQVEKDIALFEEHKYIYVGREDASDEQQLQRTPLPPIRPKNTKLTPAPQVTQPTKKETFSTDNLPPFRRMCVPPISRSGKQPIPTQSVIIPQPSPVPLPPICKKAESTPRPPVRPPMKRGVTPILPPISTKKL
ncbi:uncharacterized protein LOC143413231 [Maylandia zebra]|uniref:uncharacterized protein LOC143413231 n=1 Tax=Maylandia zebra TaxID=106582 RepID=UPI00403C22D7